MFSMGMAHEALARMLSKLTVNRTQMNGIVKVVGVNEQRRTNHSTRST